MLSVVIGSLVIAFGVLLAEYLGRKSILKQESSRKIPHVVNSVTVAVVALFVSLNTLEILILLYTLAAIVIYRYNLFSVARAVNRVSWGELFFPLGLFSATLISSNRWVFIASALVLGLSDAAAALIGTKFGKNKFKILDHTKSFEGSLAFFLTTCLVLGVVLGLAPTGIVAGMIPIVLISLVATVAEGIAPWGSDNFLVPLIIALSLSRL